MIESNFKPIIQNTKMFLHKLWNEKKKSLSFYLMLITGLILCSIYVYVRFLRSRLPREIPFQLTYYGLVLLIMICGIYMYSIKSLIKPKQTNTMINFIVQYFSKPLLYIKEAITLFDSQIKNNKFIKPHYSRLIDYIMPIILTFGSYERIFLAYSFMLIPGYILLFILMVDVFYIGKIEIFYYFIFLGLLPLLYTYYRYCLFVIKEEYFTQLESQYDSVAIYDENHDYVDTFFNVNPKAIYHNIDVSIRKYFDIQLQHQDVEYPDYDPEDPDSYEIIYVGHPYCKSNVYTEYRAKTNKIDVELTTEDFDNLHKMFLDLEPKLLDLMVYIDANQYTHNIAYIKPLRIFLYSLYFITWFYILIKSIHTLPENLTWIKEVIIVAGNVIQLLTGRCISVSFIKVGVVLTIMIIYYFYRKQ